MAKLGKYTYECAAPPVMGTTNGGNGGYERRKAMDEGVNKALKLSNSGKFAATGVTQKRGSTQ